MISLDEVEKTLIKCLNKTLIYHQKVESVPLWDAGERVLAADIIASEDVPAFDRSAVDGYALLSADTGAASEDSPISLTIIDTIAAGSYPYKRIIPGTAIKIFTGAPIPRDADCVIKKEETAEITLYSGNAIIINRSLTVGENISVKGGDISTGEFLFPRCSIISSAHMGVLASLGIDPVSVFARPEIGIFSTGNELIDLNENLQYGQLRASNLYTLAEIIRKAGGIPVNLGLVRDRVDDVVIRYEQAQRLKLPIVISTGGTASGDYDVITDAMKARKSTRLFDKAAIRPGAPFMASVKGNQLLIGLSGNPAGAIVSMLLYIFPLISRLAGTEKQLLSGRGRLTAPITRKGEQDSFLWGRFVEQAGELYVTPMENQFCCAIKTHANSNCLIEIPAGKVEFAVNDVVPFRKLP